MNKRDLLFASAILVVTSLTASQASAADVAGLAKAFGARPGLSAMRLSPNADYVVYQAPSGPRETVVMTAEVATGKTNAVTASSGKELRIRACYWGNAERLLCRIEGGIVDGANKMGFSRTIAMNRDGSAKQVIGTRANNRSLWTNQHSGRVIDLLVDDDKHVLMEVPFIPERETGTLTANDKAGLGVQRVDIYTGRGETVERPFATGSYYMTDGRGNVRLRASTDVNTLTGYTKDKRRYWVRPNGSDEWRLLATKDLDEYETFDPEGFDESGNWLFVLKQHNGRLALFKVALDGSNREELVYAHDNVDVDGLVTFGRNERPVGASYSSDYNHIEYFDPAIKAMSKALGKALPGKDVILLEESLDGTKILLFAASDTDPGGYYIFDRSTRQLKLVSVVRPGLANLTLAETKPIIYPAADGTQIPGFLTVPPGAGNKGLPLVVLPHGGPSARDYWGFDWLTQFLVANGYAVLQPNFRGSAGFGSGWHGDNAFQNWRRAIGDINDGARWAVKSGLADDKRMAILGWSYGGYAALQANVAASDLYKAAVAIAPITDLQQLKDETRYNSNARRVAEFIGTGPQVEEGSPARNAIAIKAPVLLFHGAMDLNVNVKQSRRMKDALTDAGKRVTFVEYDDLEHSFLDSDARADMLTKIGNFLHANMK